MASGLNDPLNTCPSDSSCAKAALTVPSGSASISPISSAVCGPDTSVRPLTNLTAASPGSASGSLKKRSGGLGYSSASGYAGITSRTVSTATHARDPSVLRNVVTLPESNSSSNHSLTTPPSPPPYLTAISPSEISPTLNSRSCISSASRAGGHASSAAAAIASGSKEARSRESSGNARLSDTALDLRSSNGASSRKA